MSRGAIGFPHRFRSDVALLSGRKSAVTLLVGPAGADCALLPSGLPPPAHRLPGGANESAAVSLGLTSQSETSWDGGKS